MFIQVRNSTESYIYITKTSHNVHHTRHTYKIIRYKNNYYPLCNAQKGCLSKNPSIDDHKADLYSYIIYTLSIHDKFRKCGHFIKLTAKVLAI